MRRIAAALLVASSLVALPAAAPAQSDHERVREAVQSGEILPLSAVLPRVRAQVPGRVLDATARGGGNRPWYYVVKMLTSENRVVVVTADARTGQVVDVAGRR